MYYEAEFYNSNDNDYTEQNKNTLEDIKKTDKGYRKFKKVLNKEFNGKFYKTANIELYISGDTGHLIRDAITGRYTEHLVGSKEEDLFFKTHVDMDIGGLNQGSAFYSSPDEYEKHQFTTLPPRIKQNWYSKNFYARKSEIKSAN